MLNIEQKIEEIRQKPEHIRLRYTWAMVSICMVAVLVIWFVSMKVNFIGAGNSSITDNNDMKNQFDILDNNSQEVKEKENFVGDDLGNGSDGSSIDELLEEARKSEELQGGEGVVR